LLKRISHKQSTRWQHISRLKASALFFLRKNVSCMKCNNLYSGLVMPSSGWWSPIASGAFSMKHYLFVMYRCRSKLVCSSKLVYLWLTTWKALAYHKICPFEIHYKSVMFYSTEPLRGVFKSSYNNLTNILRPGVA
jgi:hypothetical protein